MRFLRRLLDTQAHNFEPGGKLERLYALWEAQDTILFTPGSVTHQSKLSTTPVGPLQGRPATTEWSPGPGGGRLCHRGCLLDKYLQDHSAPEDVEYYLCGPPMMLKACMDMLDNLGVEPDNILFNDFG